MTTPDAACARCREPSARPVACRRISSSNDTPMPNTSAREHNPPIERAATSSTTATPGDGMRSSACTGPVRNPIADAAACVTRAISRWVTSG